MSKATTTSDGNVQLPDDSDDQFEATAQALPWGENLHGTDRHAVRQFVEVFNNSLIDAYDSISLKKVYRGEKTGELRVHLKNTSTTVGYNRVRRSIAETNYFIEDMRVLSGSTISIALRHSNE